MELRRLVQADAPVYRALMLAAYESDPEAFTATAAEREALPLSWWEHRVSEEETANEAVVGAWEGGELVGVVGVEWASRPKTRHKVKLFGVYVDQSCRGQGIGRRLVQAALELARSRPGIQVAQLTVTAANTAAEALYRQCGFATFGVEPMAIAVGNELLAKIHMWRRLGDG